MAKFNKGDKVRLLPHLPLNMGKCEDVQGVNSEMQQFQSRVVTIKEVVNEYGNDGIYEINEDGGNNWWTDPMFQNIVEKAKVVETPTDKDMYVKQVDGNISLAKVVKELTDDDGTKKFLVYDDGVHRLLLESDLPSMEEVKQYKDNQKLLIEIEEAAEVVKAAQAALDALIEKAKSLRLM